MNWNTSMLKRFFVKAEEAKLPDYEIGMEMVSDSVVRMDMNSFRRSKAVQAQAAAAKRSFEKFEKA